MYNQRVNRGFVANRDRARLQRLAAAFTPAESPLQPQQLDSLSRFLELVASWNKKLDLTAARETDALIEVMLADAFVLASMDVIPAASRCIDVGSGAGAPALPLAILREDLTLLLVEPLRKRVAFLRTVLGSLALVSRVEVREQKLDPAMPVLSEGRFDVALSRATFAPEIWLGAGAKIATRVAVMLAQQPPPAADGALRERVVEYSLPFSGAERKLVVYASQ